MASFQMTTSQIDKLGKRLTKEPISDIDLNLLDQYRLSFSDAYDAVTSTLQRSGFNVTGRPTKSTQSIISKLHRERTRLSTMQDIAGCRLVVTNLVNQNDVHSELLEIFEGSVIKVVDRRIQPSHGYRAIHLIISMDTKFLEIQLRTAAQHFWANLCEICCDIYGYELKYGFGEIKPRLSLDRFSEQILEFDNNEGINCSSMVVFNEKFSGFLENVLGKGYEDMLKSLELK